MDTNNAACTAVDDLQLTKSGIINRGPFRRAALKTYIKRMSKGDTRALFDGFVAQTLAKQGITWNYDPRSIYEPDQLYTALARYGPNNHKRIDIDPALQRGIDMAWKVFAKPKDGIFSDELKVIKTDSELIEALDLSKSAGLPSMKSKADDIIYAMDREHQIRSGEKSPNPCVAGARTSANHKTRLVWMYPLEMTIMESRFARPLIDKFLNMRTTMAFGLYKYELGSTISWEIEPKGICHCLDYSKFDSSIPAKLIHIAFDILATWFSQSDKDEYGWSQILGYFISTPIVMPDGHLYTGKRHGVPSGSYFTQLIDSIVNTILIGAVFHAFKVKENWRSILVLGDDSIFPVDWELPLTKVANFLARYGIKLNVEKSLTGHAHFLGAEWEKSLSHRDEVELASRLVYPEKFRKYDKDQGIEQQANNVIANYASQYIEAFRFIDLNYAPVALESMLALFVQMRENLLSGSDRFMLRSLQLTGKLAHATAVQGDPTATPTRRILT